MKTILPILFLAVILCLFSATLQARLRRWLRKQPHAILLAPAILTAILCLAAWNAGAASVQLAALFFAYTFAPTVAAIFAQRFLKPPSWADMAVVLMLWLPLEFGAGARWIPRSAQGAMHTVAYGAAITLALMLLLVYRDLKGIKYNLPLRWRDWAYPLAGFAIAAPMLIALGLVLSFLKPFHVPGTLSGWMLGKQFALILVATALPEEILFRGLIQNWIMQKFGSGNPSLVAAAVIFGCSHLNNAPGPLPNWRYAIVATIAGLAFGKVFQKASSVWSSAMLHGMINTAKHVFF
jgi:uncharacterized protein